MFYNNVETTFDQCPFGEALEQMPDNAKFMKDLVTKKRLVTFEDDDRLQHCSAIATRSLVQKKEDPGAFTIACIVGSLHFAKALCDLGASINLMPLSRFTRSWVWVTQSPLRCGY